MSSTSDSAPADSLPHLMLRVGGLGNRQLGVTPEQEEVVKARVKEVLSEIDKLLLRVLQEDAKVKHAKAGGFWGWLAQRRGGLFGCGDRWGAIRQSELAAPVFRSGKPRIKLLVGDAAGADALIREAGQSHSGACDCTCHAVFLEEADFTQHATLWADEPRAAGAALDVTQESPPPGLRSVPVDDLRVGVIPTAANGAANQAMESLRTQGFRAQGDLLCHHSDLLLAVWKTEEPGDAGGTVETVRNALEQEIPVIAVRVSGVTSEVTVDLLRHPSHLRHSAKHGKFDEELQTVVEALTKFPDQFHHSAGHGHPSDYQSRRVFLAFAADRFHSRCWVRYVWSGFEFCMKRLVSLLKRLASKQPDSTPNQPAPAPRPARKRAPRPVGFQEHYAPVMKRASESPYGHAHRGGVLLSYTLAVFAVVLAVLGVIGHEHRHGSVPYVAVAEVLVILFLILLSSVSKRDDWHEAYTDARLLAEALRMMEFLGPLGLHTPVARLPTHLRQDPDHHQPENSWATWYWRCLVRMAPMRLGALTSQQDCTTLREAVEMDWIQDQERHHKANAEKYETLHQVIEWISDWLLLVILAAAAAHAAHAIVEAAGFHWMHLPEWASPVTVFICICGPALISAMHGFGSQIECNRLRKRSASLAALLKESRQRIHEIDMATAPSIQCMAVLSTEALAAAKIMMDETAGWTLLYKGADIHAG